MAERPEGGRPQNAASNNALGALLTMFAMLCFAGMDAISKWLVADYAVTQMMWIRSWLFFLFAWFVVLGAIGERPCSTLGYTAYSNFKCGVGAVRGQGARERQCNSRATERTTVQRTMGIDHDGGPRVGGRGLQ